MKETIALFETNNWDVGVASKTHWNEVVKDTCSVVKTVFVEVDSTTFETLKTMPESDFVEIVQTFIDETPNALHSN